MDNIHAKWEGISSRHDGRGPEVRRAKKTIYDPKHRLAMHSVGFFIPVPLRNLA